MNEKIKESLKEKLEVVANGGATLIGGILSDTLVGQVAPGIATTVLSYKQKRTEKMIMHTLDEVKNRLNNIESYLKDMEEEKINFIKNKALPIMFDFVIDEQQEEKIEFIVNGMENIITYRITDEDLILTYFDVLNKLRIIDIKELLEIYNYSPEEMRVSVSSSPINETDAVKKHIYKKLQKYDLISMPFRNGELSGKEYTVDKTSATINVFGKSFIKFIVKQNNESKT